VEAVVNGIVSGAVRADVDWFSFTPDDDGTLIATLAGAAGALDLNVVDAASVFPFGLSFGRRTGSNEQVAVDLRAGTAVLLSVHDYEWSGVDLPYALTVSFVPGEVNEPDFDDTP